MYCIITCIITCVVTCNILLRVFVMIVILRYQEGKQTDASNDHMIADKIDGVSWKSLREGKEYAKFAVRGIEYKMFLNIIFSSE